MSNICCYTYYNAQHIQYCMPLFWYRHLLFSFLSFHVHGDSLRDRVRLYVYLCICVGTSKWVRAKSKEQREREKKNETPKF